MKKIITFASDHYQFHVFTDSLAEKEIEDIKRSQELARTKIVDFLGIDNDRQIDYYLYPSSQAKLEAMGDDGNGNAFPDKFAVHAIYNESVKCIGPHEDTHIFAAALGLPPQLLREGLAEYMCESWDGEPHDYWAKKYLVEGKMLNLYKMFGDENWYDVDDTISYPIAGSLVGFLVRNFGKEKFLELYSALSRDFPLEKNLNIFNEAIGQFIQTVQHDWESRLIK